MTEGLPERREYLYGLHGVYLDAYDAVVDPNSVWPISHYVLRRWAPILGPSAFWLLVTLQQLCYRNPASNRNNWCQISRTRLARETSLGEGSIHRLLHEESCRTSGLCHWVRYQEQRSWSGEVGTVVQRANRYDIVLTPPLAPVDQHGLAQFLLENGVEAGGDFGVAVPLLEELACRESLDDLLMLLGGCAERFSPPPGWPAEVFLSTPLDVIRALRLQMPAEERLREAAAHLCSQVHRALTRQPQPLLQTNYFRQRWVPRLGHTLALLVVVLRSQCFWDERTLRDTITMYPSEMAESIGLTSSRQVTCLLDKPDAQMFISVVESGRGRPVKAKILLREPIVPEDQLQYQNLLLPKSHGQQMNSENGHFGRQTNGENGHFGRLIDAENGHFGHLTDAENGHFGRLTGETSDILDRGMDILDRENGHFGHHVNTIITVSTYPYPSLKEQKHGGNPASAAALLLNEFDIGPPASSRILTGNPNSNDLRAWMLYTLTQPGLRDAGKGRGYLINRLKVGEAPPVRFRRWAELTREEWRALWRANRYGGPYVEALPPALAADFDAWAGDFGEVFPQGAFGDEMVTPSGVKNLIVETLSPPGDFRVEEDGHTCALRVIPEGDEVISWVKAQRQAIASMLAQRGILHAVGVAENREPERGVETGGEPASKESQIWRAALDELQLQMTQATFDTWLRESKQVSYEGGVMVVRVKNEYARDWLENRLHNTVRRTLARLAGCSVEVRYVVLEHDA